MSTATDVFGQRTSPFYGIDLGAKIPGVHWRVGEWQGGNVILGDRMAELNAGLISTSRGDWDNNSDGRGYRPMLSMFSSLQPAIPGTGSRVVPFFTAVEMPDGVDGLGKKTMPNTNVHLYGMTNRKIFNALERFFFVTLTESLGSTPAPNFSCLFAILYFTNCLDILKLKKSYWPLY
jgi:hypothetical protein